MQVDTFRQYIHIKYVCIDRDIFYGLIQQMYFGLSDLFYTQQ